VNAWLTYLSRNWDTVLELTVAHALVTLTAVGIGTVVGVSLGVLSYRNPRSRGVVLRTTGLLLTIPSLALYALLITIPGPGSGSLLGLGTRPVLVALTLYSLLPIVRNTITGLLSVDPAIVESAQGMGMDRWTRLRKVELPLAWPVVITGIRVSTMVLLGIAALGAIVNGPGLGELLFRGLSLAGRPAAIPPALTGFLGVVALAVLFEVLFNLLTRLTTSRGVR
jgi:osmoprotectant transport system permease protein